MKDAPQTPSPISLQAILHQRRPSEDDSFPGVLKITPTGYSSCTPQKKHMHVFFQFFFPVSSPGTWRPSKSVVPIKHGLFPIWNDLVLFGLLNQWGGLSWCRNFSLWIEIFSLWRRRYRGHQTRKVNTLHCFEKAATHQIHQVPLQCYRSLK